MVTFIRNYRLDRIYHAGSCDIDPLSSQNFRFTKSSMLDAIHQDYVRTARAKGATEKVVIWKHVLKMRFSLLSPKSE